ncbi:MAG: tetratricopeptide repeat protein, partial [Micropepsaceae bacterium]
MDQATAQSTLHAAQALARAGNVDGAIAKLQSVLSEAPDDAYTLALLAAYELQRSRPGDAETAARAAVKSDPSLAIAHRILGLIDQQKKRYADAEKDFRTAVELEPDAVFVADQPVALDRAARVGDPTVVRVGVAGLLHVERPPHPPVEPDQVVGGAAVVPRHAVVVADRDPRVEVGAGPEVRTAELPHVHRR